MVSKKDTSKNLTFGIYQFIIKYQYVTLMFVIFLAWKIFLGLYF